MRYGVNGSTRKCSESWAYNPTSRPTLASLATGTPVHIAVSNSICMEALDSHRMGRLIELRVRRGRPVDSPGCGLSLSTRFGRLDIPDPPRDEDRS